MVRNMSVAAVVARLYGGGALGLTLLVGLLAALGPALRAAALDPWEVIRCGR